MRAAAEAQGTALKPTYAWDRADPTAELPPLVTPEEFLAQPCHQGRFKLLHQLGLDARGGGEGGEGVGGGGWGGCSLAEEAEKNQDVDVDSTLLQELKLLSVVG